MHKRLGNCFVRGRGRIGIKASNSTTQGHEFYLLKSGNPNLFRDATMQYFNLCAPFGLVEFSTSDCSSHNNTIYY